MDRLNEYHAAINIDDMRADARDVVITKKQNGLLLAENKKWLQIYLVQIKTNSFRRDTRKYAGQNSVCGCISPIIVFDHILNKIFLCLSPFKDEKMPRSYFHLQYTPKVVYAYPWESLKQSRRAIVVSNSCRDGKSIKKYIKLFMQPLFICNSEKQITSLTLIFLLLKVFLLLPNIFSRISLDGSLSKQKIQAELIVIKEHS